MTEMEKQNRIVLNLLVEKMPIIAWDWDMTLSMNGVHALEQLIYIQDQMTMYYGFTHIIVTGRNEIFKPLNIKGEVLFYKVFYNTEGGPPIRFKLWILHKFYNKGNGILRLYIDNDETVLDTLRKSYLPVCNGKSHDLTWYRDNLLILRQLEGNERIKQRSL